MAVKESIVKLVIIISVSICLVVLAASLADVRCSAVRPAQNMVVVACGAGRMP